MDSLFTLHLIMHWNALEGGEVRRTVVFCTIRDALPGFTGDTIPENPPSFSAFTRYWDVGHPSLRLSKGGSDYCDCCTSFRNEISRLSIDEERHRCLTENSRNIVTIQQGIMITTGQS